MITKHQNNKKRHALRAPRADAPPDVERVREHEHAA